VPTTVASHNRIGIQQARGLLVETPERPASSLGVLGAAALAAFAAVLMAGVMVLGPGFALDHPRAASDSARS
jgi:hypothetical protein